MYSYVFNIYRLPHSNYSLKIIQDSFEKPLQPAFPEYTRLPLPVEIETRRIYVWAYNVF